MFPKFCIFFIGFNLVVGSYVPNSHSDNEAAPQAYNVRDKVVAL